MVIVLFSDPRWYEIASSGPFTLAGCTPIVVIGGMGMRLAKQVFGALCCVAGLALVGVVIVQVPGGAFVSDLWGTVLKASGGVLILATGASILLNA